MKRYLSILCALLVLTSFASCGDSSNSNSFDSSEASESSVSETVTEEETEATTKAETKEINPFLDKKITCDYLSFYAPSEWNPDVSTYTSIDGTSIFFEWEDKNETYYSMFSIYSNENNKDIDYKDYSKYEVLDKFTIDGQEYVVIQAEKEATKAVLFANDEINCSIYYPALYEDIVMDMVESIEFNPEETTESQKINLEKPPLKVKRNFGDISFELPENFEESEGTSTDTLKSMKYKFEDESSLTVMSSEWSDYSLYESDDELKRLTFESLLKSVELMEPVGASETMEINGEFALHQNASNMGIFNVSEYIFCYKDKVYVFDFSDLTETSTQALDIQDEIINSISFDKNIIETNADTERTTEPPTEPPTEKPAETQPPVVETSPVQNTLHFVLNLETSCIHIQPDCNAAQKITPENFSTVDIAESDLINYNGIYWACGKCSKNYTDELPKF